jgi:hypothetical protein
LVCFPSGTGSAVPSLHDRPDWAIRELIKPRELAEKPEPMPLWTPQMSHELPQ